MHRSALRAADRGFSGRARAGVRSPAPLAHQEAAQPRAPPLRRRRRSDGLGRGVLVHDGRHEAPLAEVVARQPVLAGQRRHVGRIARNRAKDGGLRRRSGRIGARTTHSRPLSRGDIFLPVAPGAAPPTTALAFAIHHSRVTLADRDPLGHEAGCIRAKKMCAAQSCKTDGRQQGCDYDCLQCATDESQAGCLKAVARAVTVIIDIRLALCIHTN